jgi:hypothetical protein
MSVYVITGVSRGIGVSLSPSLYSHCILLNPAVVRVRQAALRRQGQPHRRPSPQQGGDREEGGRGTERPL